MITGGWGAEIGVEMWSPYTGHVCTGPDLPEGRGYHSAGGTALPGSAVQSLSRADLIAAGLVLCGGDSAPTATSCISWAPGTSTWTTYATIQSRKAHMSWVTKTGQLYLLGGNRASGTLSSTEIVGVGPGFSLQRPTE